MLIESFHSGQRGQRRYCSLHRPQTRLVRSTGVVLCYPLGHEYFRAHRSYVKLADQLANLGFPVIRFDYFGSGDSEGDAGYSRLDDWLNEVAEIVDELKRSEPVSNIALGGLRFGGALSLLAARRLDAVRALILWDPVIEGAPYVDELQRLHARMLTDLERFARPRRLEECTEGELVGTRYSPRFLHELSGISPSTLAVTGIRDVVLVNTTGNRRPDALVDGFKGTQVRAIQSPRDYGWSNERRIGESIIDPDAIRHVTASMNAVAA